jgi:hypothetical protein
VDIILVEGISVVVRSGVREGRCDAVGLAVTVGIEVCVIGKRFDGLGGVDLNIDMDGFTFVGVSFLKEGDTLIDGSRLGRIDTEGAGDDEGLIDGCNEVVGPDDSDGPLDIFIASCILYVAENILAIVGHFPAAV